MVARQGPSPAETFRKILQLEEKRGFDNKAVAGGLDRFIDRQREELVEGIDPSTTSEYGLRSGLASLGPRHVDPRALLAERYGEMDAARRREWVGLWMGMMGAMPSPPVSPSSSGRRGREIREPHHPPSPSSPSKEKREGQTGHPRSTRPRLNWDVDP